MNSMRDVVSQKILEQQLISDNLLCIKTRDEESTRLYIYYVIEPSFTTFLIKGKRFFKYPNQEEGQYAIAVIDSKVIVYKPVTDESEKVVNGEVQKAYDIRKNDFVEPYLLPDSFMKDYFTNLTSVQKKLGTMPTKIEQRNE